ncbi:MAG: hypothetical protein DMG38_21900 [Acidobacteria bacterium]|nr:MAG: hypothetical protein DMG38_21900 [Acidobacteriota bacterium]
MCTDALPGGFPVFGDLGVGVLRDQFFCDVDFSLSKRFRISEQKSLQIRAEAFNIFNMQILYRNSGRGRHFRHARSHPQHRKHAAKVATRSEICFFKRERWLAFDCATIYFVARRPHAAVLGPVELST